jgi:hypothetical protein
VNDPIEHAFESQAFEVKDYFLFGFFRKARLMYPNPNNSQYQGDCQEEQPQTRVARAGGDAGLSHLPKTGFDAKPFPVEFADLRRAARYAPRREEQLLAFSFSRFAIPVMAVVYAHRNIELFFAPFFIAWAYQPAGWRLIYYNPVGFAPFLGGRPRNITGIRKGNSSC